MRLTDVFSKYDQFKRLDVSEIRNKIINLQNNIDSTTSNVSDSKDNILSDLNVVLSKLDDFEYNKDKIYTEFDNKIKGLEKKYLVNSYHTYENRFKRDLPPDIVKYPANTTKKEHIVEIRSMLKQYVDWTYPGLEIQPKLGKWTSDLVGCDPLYIVDRYSNFLQKTIEKFTPEYQRRIRPYLIKDDDLSILPQQQFGIVFAWEVFEYLPYENIKDYLKSINNLLKPGGICFFSYNNCELYGNCQLAEEQLRCYMTKTKLQDLTEGLGFSILRLVDRAPHLSYAIIQKKGADFVDHNRSGSTLGLIKTSN